MLRHSHRGTERLTQLNQVAEPRMQFRWVNPCRTMLFSGFFCGKQPKRQLNICSLSVKHSISHPPLTLRNFRTQWSTSKA